MDKDIEFFINTLSNIGSRDDSLYDTLIRDSILEIVLKPPLSEEVAISNALQLRSHKETKNLNNAVRSLLSAFEHSGAGQPLESLIKNYVLSLPANANQRLAVDEVFGDYFDDSSEDNRELPTPIRNFFYSPKCYIVFTVLPVIIVGLVMLTVIPQTLFSGVVLHILATMILCCVVFLAGDQLYNYLNTKIQKYEGKL